MIEMATNTANHWSLLAGDRNQTTLNKHHLNFTSNFLTTDFSPINSSADLGGDGRGGGCGSSTDDATIEMIASRVVPVFFGLIGLTGLLGNALVVLVIVSNRSMRSTTNVLIINLAMADLLFVVFCVPFTAIDYMMEMWPFGDLWCKIVQYLIVVTSNASIYTLVLMSLDRFLAVVYPIASRAWRTEKNTTRACTVMWVVILTAGLPAWFAHGIKVIWCGSNSVRVCVYIYWVTKYTHQNRIWENFKT